jgi:hypothetical protein
VASEQPLHRGCLRVAVLCTTVTPRLTLWLHGAVGVADPVAAVHVSMESLARRRRSVVGTSPRVAAGQQQQQQQQEEEVVTGRWDGTLGADSVSSVLSGTREPAQGSAGAEICWMVPLAPADVGMVGRLPGGDDDQQGRADVLRFTARCARSGQQLGSARLALRHQPPLMTVGAGAAGSGRATATADAVLAGVEESEAVHPVSVALPLTTGTEPDMAGLSPLDYAEAVSELGPQQVANTLAELRVPVLLPPPPAPGSLATAASQAATTTAASSAAAAAAAARRQLAQLYSPVVLDLTLARTLMDPESYTLSPTLLPELAARRSPTPPPQPRSSTAALLLCHWVCPEHGGLAPQTCQAVRRVVLQPSLRSVLTGHRTAPQPGWAQLPAHSRARILAVRVDGAGQLLLRLQTDSGEGWAPLVDRGMTQLHVEGSLSTPGGNAWAARPLMEPAELYIHEGGIQVLGPLSGGDVRLIAKLGQLQGWEIGADVGSNAGDQDGSVGVCFRIARSCFEARVEAAGGYGTTDSSSDGDGSPDGGDGIDVYFSMSATDALALRTTLGRILRCRLPVGGRAAARGRYPSVFRDGGTSDGMSANPLRTGESLGTVVLGAPLPLPTGGGSRSLLLRMLRKARFHTVVCDSLEAALVAAQEQPTASADLDPVWKRRSLLLLHQDCPGAADLPQLCRQIEQHTSLSGLTPRQHGDLGDVRVVLPVAVVLSNDFVTAGPAAGSPRGSTRWTPVSRAKTTQAIEMLRAAGVSQVLRSPLISEDVAQLSWLLQSGTGDGRRTTGRRAAAAGARRAATGGGGGDWMSSWDAGRVAKGLKAKQHLTDKLAKPMQRLVGGSKARFVDKARNFDLNLCYITQSCIAMGLPAASTEGLIRNNIKEVSRFFEAYHPGGKYKIFNLCIERTYDTSWFRDLVSWYPTHDHNVPMLHMLHDLCLSAERWLQADPEHVIAIHCKGGKGRTGVGICAHLVQFWGLSAAQALLAYENARTVGWSVGSDKESQGVTGRSQIRYIGYYADLIAQGRTYQLYDPPPVCLALVHLENAPTAEPGSSDRIFVWCTLELNYAEVRVRCCLPLPS